NDGDVLDTSDLRAPNPSRKLLAPPSLHCRSSKQQKPYRWARGPLPAVQSIDSQVSRSSIGHFRIPVDLDPERLQSVSSSARRSNQRPNTFAKDRSRATDRPASYPPKIRPTPRDRE